MSVLPVPPKSTVEKKKTKDDKQLTDRVMIPFFTQSTMRPFFNLPPFFYLLRFGSVRSYENTNNILYILSPKKFDIPTVHKICIVNPD